MTDLCDQNEAQRMKSVPLSFHDYRCVSRISSQSVSPELLGGGN